MPVPFIDLQRFEPDFQTRWLERVTTISARTQFVGGPAVATLEQRMASDTGVETVVGCANGTDALQLGLRALGVGAGDRVLLPDATFWATFEAIVNCGAHPVTVDIDPTDLQMDFDLFREAVERHQPKAAILVHLYGWGSARLEEFRSFCREHALPLLEDGAQAYGVTRHGKPIYQDAQMATVSFYPAKVLGSCGDAGAVFCSSTSDAEIIRQLCNHGRTTHYEHGLLGWNSRLGGLDAAYLDLSLDYLEARLDQRRAITAAYRERLGPLGVEMVAPPAGFVENGYLNVCRFAPDERERVGSILREHGIGFGTVYPGAMSEQPGANGYLVEHVGGTQARDLGRSVLNLPVFAGMTTDELDEVVSVVASALS